MREFKSLDESDDDTPIPGVHLACPRVPSPVLYSTLPPVPLNKNNNCVQGLPGGSSNE
jgi:hypothetical protein